MKNAILSCLCFLVTTGLLAQIPDGANLYDSDSLKTGDWVLYYDSLDQKVSKDSTFVYCMLAFERGVPTSAMTCYYANGIKQWEGGMSSIDPDIKQGAATFYYPLGNIQMKANFINNVTTGPLEGYFENGQLNYSGMMKEDKNTGFWQFYYPNGNLQANGDFTAGKKDGDWEFFHDNEQLQTKGRIEQELYQGHWTVYYQNGQLSNSAYYTDNLKNGEYLAYFENGVMSQKGRYEDGLQHGEWKYYSENNTLASEGKIIMGQFQGKWDFYHSNGNIESNRVYVDDVENGYFKYYYEDGSLKSQGHVTNEQWDGDIEFYYQNGNLNSKGEIVNGLYQGPWKSYYEDGNLNAIKTYRNDTLEGYWEKRYENGLVQEKGALHAGLKTGPWEVYFDNGQLSYTGNYQNNLKSGHFDHYYENGEKKNSGLYSADLQIGEWNYYHNNGALSCFGLYEEGKSEGHWKYFYENGVLKKEGNEHLERHDGFWKYYFESGVLKSQGEEIMGKRNGLWQYYHPNGHLETSGNTFEGGAIGVWQFYDSLGRKKSEGKWRDNLKDSTWVYYDTLGRKREVGNFVNNKVDGTWWIYEAGKKDYKEHWNLGTELNFWNLRDSSEQAARRHENDLAFDIAKAAKKQWRKTYDKDDVGYHFYWSMMGYVYKNIGDLDEADQYYNRALKEVERIESDTSWNYGIILGKLAGNFYDMGWFQKAVDNYQKEIQILAKGSEGKSDLSYFNTLNALSRAYLYNKEAAKGIQLLKDDLKFRLETNPDQIHKIAEDYGKLAELYYRDYQYDSSKLTYAKYFRYLKENELSNHSIEGDSYRQMAYVCDALDQYDSVFYYHHQSIQCHRKQNKTSSVAYVLNYNGIANNYYRLNQYQKMDQYADSSLFLIEQNNLKNFDVYYEALIAKSRASVQLYQYEDASQTYQLALAAVLSKPVVDKQYLSNCYQGLGICNESMNKIELAVEYFQKSVAVYDDPMHYNPFFTNAHLLLSSLYTNQKQYSKSKDHLTILKKYFERLNHPDAYNEGRIYQELGILAYRQYKYDSAKIHYRKALTYYGDQENFNVFKYADVLDYLADIAEDLNKQDEAQKLILESLALLEEHVGKQHQSYESQLLSLAIHHRKRGNYQNAIVFLLQVLEAKEIRFGKASPGYTAVEQTLATTYLYDEQYDKALETAEQMKTNLLVYADEDDEDYLDYLKIRGDVYKKREKYEEAERYFKSWLVAAGKFYGTSHEDYAYYLREVGRMYKYFNKNETALPYLRTAVNILATTQGTENQKYAWSLETLGEIYYSLENYKEALIAKEQVISIYKNVYGATSNYHINAKSSLANLYYKLGRYADSEALYHESLLLCESGSGKYSTSYVDLLEEEGNMYRWWLKPDLAIKQSELGIEILDSLEDIHESRYFGFYNVMGLALQDLGRLDESEEFYLKARDGALRNWGKEGSYYTYINNLSFVYLEREEYAKAEKMMLEAGDRFKTREVVKDLDQVNYEDNLATLYLAWGKMDQAEEYWTRVIDILLKRINANFAYMSESEKANFWNEYKKDFEYFNSYALKASVSNPKAIGQMYDNQLQTKSILLSSSTKERSKIINSGDSTLISHYFRYIDLKEDLSKYYGYTSTQLLEEDIQLDSLEKVANGFEKELSINANALEKEVRAKNIRWKDIQRKLGEDEAAVEIIRFRHFDKHVTDSVLYAAMILTSETRKKPALVVLPNGNELETKYMKNYLSSVKYKVEDKHSYQQYWEQIDTQLKGKSVVYFSPDGVYNQLNVNTFKRSDGTYILDQYNLHIMTSTKDVVLLDSELKAGLGTQVATLFGFPQYDLKHSSIETFVEERSLERSRNVEREIDLARFGFAELPGTKTETESIVEILSANEWDAKLYLGDEALEEAIKSVSSPNVLHIATHGFFLDDVERKDQLQLGVSTQHSRKNPLLRSGLLLAGAAQTVQGDYQNKTENGILTAYEAMNLDLNDTDLVVLSACETGRGEVKSGEGVYGLQRAFQVAGAESLIMSLWKVNDDATQLLMTNFYQNWLSGLNKNEAFKKAQMTVRAQFSAPYYWGAFVMVGN